MNHPRTFRNASTCSPVRCVMVCGIAFAGCDTSTLATPISNDPVAQPATPLPADKSGYHLFNPTPRELMRELSADRPDVTESPYTVDAGHVQIELSFVDFVREGSADTWTVMPTNFKVGVLNNLDVQLVFEPYVRAEQEATSLGTLHTDEGFGDVQLRVKLNLWGNDGGNSGGAGAIMPFVTFPTATHDAGSDHVEGGVILPFATDLGDGWSLGLMPEFDIVHDDDGEGYHLEFVHTATVGHDIAGSLAGYIEYVGILSSESGADYQALLGVGVTYGLNPDWQLDAGINFGLTDSADDLNPFIGMTVRF